MNKTAPPVDKTLSQLAQTPLPSLKSVAVGRDARPQITMRWTAAYVDGHYYLADPESMQQLQQVQAQIELEKQLANSRVIGKGRAESVRDFAVDRDEAEYSRVTEVDPRRQLAAASKAVRQLEKEEELYARRLGEARNKKKEEKKRNRNLIKVPQQADVDFQSVKGQQAKRKSSDVVLGHSVHQNGAPSEKKPTQMKQPLITPLQMQSIVLIKVQDPPKPTNDDRANIQLTESRVMQEKQAKLTNRSKVKSVKIEIDPSILDHASTISRLNQAKQQQRAGTSFFYRIHNDLAQLEQNINGQHNTNINYQQILSPTPIMQPSSPARVYAYKQSEALVSAKCILKELNQQLREAGLIEPEQDSQATVQLPAPIQPQTPSESSRQSQPVIETSSQRRRNQEDSRSNISYEPFLKGLEQKSKEPLPALDFSKKKIALSVQPSIVNYQIAQGTAPKEDRSEEKQKLNEEISLLRQVVGQLRVERLKYQITQQSRLHGEQSGYVSQNKSAAAQNLVIPQHSSEQSHRVTASIFHNFQESVVSEFTGSPHRSMLGRSISGRIIRNASGQRKTTRFEEKDSVSKAIAEERIQSEEQNNEEEELKKKEKSVIVRQNSKALSLIGEDAVLSQSAILAKPVEIEPIKPLEQSILAKSRQSSSLMKKGSRSVVAMPHKQEPEVQTVVRNCSQRAETDLQISMPRPLNKSNNKSQVPQFVIQHKPSPNKKLLNNFHAQIKSSKQPQQSQQQQQTMDPRRRAAREGLLKNIEAKTPHNPQLNQFASTGDVSIKRKIYDSEQRQIKQRETKEAVNIFVKTTERQSQVGSSGKGFRLRKESESSRSSRVSYSNQSSKSCGCNRKLTEQVVYVPALAQMKPDQTNTPRNDPKIYELEFQTNPRDNVIEGFQISQRDMNFDQINIPNLPQPPSPGVGVEQMVLLIRALAKGLGFELKQVELQKLIMKKYKNCIMLDLPIGKGQKLVWHYTGRVYVGDWNERTMLKEGEGKDYIPDKYFYRGHFQDGKRSGYGSLLQPSGACYEGHWLDGERNGQGRFLDPALKLFYDGQWREGRRQGSGYLKVQDQSIYEGHFEANYRHGFGTEVFVNGDSYRGQYKRGRFHGKGHYIWASGASYEGNFCEGCKHGRGVWKSQTGERYEGDYHQDKKSGKGQYEWVDGSIFEGYFERDQKHGQGTLYYADGRQIRGTWQDGKMIGDPEEREDESENEKPLAHRKSRAYETVTIMKVVESRPQRLSSVGKLPNF